MTRKKWNAEDKQKIVLTGLRNKSLINVPRGTNQKILFLELHKYTGRALC
jgi:hypothetical protein